VSFAVSAFQVAESVAAVGASVAGKMESLRRTVEVRSSPKMT